MRRLIPALGLASFLWVAGARAYPSFIGYGYSSCLTCHFNPLGNGPITDYGRALSATTISGRPPFLPDRITDEDLGEAAGFAGPAKLPNWFRPSLSYRGLRLTSKLGQSDQSTYWYNMQQEANVVVKFNEDRIYASGTLGYSPDLSTGPTNSHIISREHYVGARLDDHWGAYVGFMDIAYGVRVPDHEAFSRLTTFLTENDQTHGALVHYTSDKLEAAVHGFVGNLYQSQDTQLKGASAIVEYETWPRARLGASLLHAQNNYRRRNLGAVHLRSGLGREGQSILAELGLIDQDTVAPASTLANYLFVQSMHRLFRGFHLLGNLEYYSDQAFQPRPRLVRLGPSIQWFPFQRLELRSDLLGSFAVASAAGNNFNLMWLNQIHLSF